MNVRILSHSSQLGSRRTKRSLLDYLDLYKQRRALAKLDASQLHDIGLSQADVEAELRRPVWDAPSHWSR